MGETAAANKQFAIMRSLYLQNLLLEFKKVSPVRTFAFRRHCPKQPSVTCNFETT